MKPASLDPECRPLGARDPLQVASEGADSDGAPRATRGTRQPQGISLYVQDTHDGRAGALRRSSPFLRPCASLVGLGVGGLPWTCILMGIAPPIGRRAR